MAGVPWFYGEFSLMTTALPARLPVVGPSHCERACSAEQVLRDDQPLPILTFLPSVLHYTTSDDQ